MAPALKRDALVGAVRYYDAQADDARHTMMVGRTAAQYGAVVRTSTQVVDFLHEVDRVAGVHVRDVETGRETDVRAHVVVNCTGVWTDQMQHAAGTRGRFRVKASKGVHFLVARDKIPSDVGMILRTEKSVLFVIPWRNHWIVGTTDTDWHLDLAHPAATRHDIDYLLEHVNNVLVTPLSHDDIEGVYAGLRPLLAGESEETSKLSREHAVSRVMPGMVSIAGGKYTTYRVMAKPTRSTRPPRTSRPASRPSVTDRVPLHRRGRLLRADQPGRAARAALRPAPAPRPAPARPLRLVAARTARDERRATRRCSSRCPASPDYLRWRSPTRWPTRARCTSTTS